MRIGSAMIDPVPQLPLREKAVLETVKDGAKELRAKQVETPEKSSSDPKGEEAVAASVTRLAQSTKELMESREKALTSLKQAGEQIGRSVSNLREIHARVVEAVTPSVSMDLYGTGGFLSTRV